VRLFVRGEYYGAGRHRPGRAPALLFEPCCLPNGPGPWLHDRFEQARKDADEDVRLDAPRRQ